MRKNFFHGFFTCALALVLPMIAMAQHDHSMMGGAPEAPVEKVENFKYMCPLHAEVVSDAMGACYKCGANLEQKTVEAGKSSTDKVYFYCPDHSSLKLEKKGRCAKCGHKLKKGKVFTYD